MAAGDFTVGLAAHAVDALARADAPMLGAAVALHVSGQVCRGLAWHGVLSPRWPALPRRRACAWHVCGAGLSGVLSARGGDAVRLALARRELPGATWPELLGTLAAEGSFETVAGVVLGLVALRLGVGTMDAPAVWALAAVAAGLALLAFAAARCARVRRAVGEVRRGVAVLGRPRTWALRILPWQVAARVLRLGAVACFVLAFGLPTAPAVVLAASVAQGSGAMLPVPAAGPATVAAALLVALPVAAGHPVDPGAVMALAIVQPAALTTVGAALSLILLGALSGARSPRALVHAARALRTPAAPASAAP